MTTYSFFISDFMLEVFESYHQYWIKENYNRSLEETIIILFKYAIGSTTKISEKEFIMIETYFEKKEHIFGQFAKDFLLSGIELKNNNI